VLEQEGKRLGADEDPEAKAKIDFGKTNATVEFAIRKLSAQPNDKQLRDEYAKSQGQMDTVDLSHIVIAYQGSQIPPRHPPGPTREAAMKIAEDLEAKIRAGEPFEKL